MRQLHPQVPAPPLDLSGALFVATATNLGPVPAMPRERMTAVELSGYTDAEKRVIATDHLLPLALAFHRLTADDVRFTDAAVDTIVRGYVREAVQAAGGPNEGASAGITMAAALVSALTGCPLRGDVAMTGNLGLGGQVLPVAAIRDKVLAAHRSGLARVVLPLGNRKQVDEDLGDDLRRAVAVDYVAGIDELLELALRRAPAPEGLRARPAAFVLGELAIDDERRRVSLAGRVLELTVTEYELLCVLSRHAGKVVTHETLFQQVWGDRHSDSATAARTYVKKLRCKLGDDAVRPTYILNERGVGYRMPAPSD